MRGLLIAVAVLIVTAATAQAQINRTYAIRGGTGTQCSLTTPCNSLFYAAESLFSAGGIIHLLSPGDYGSVLNNGEKSINVQGPGYDAIIDGYGLAGTGQTGSVIGVSVVGGTLRYTSSGTGVTIENVRFSQNASSGVDFAPTAQSSVVVRNSVFDRASSGTGAAIRIVTGGQTVNVSLDNVQVSGGIRGISVDTTGGGFARISIRNSTFSNISGPAILATAGSGKIRLYIDDVTTVNSGVGISANGANVIGWIGETTVAGNNIGIQRTGNANLMSFKNNYVYNNNTDGTPLPQTWAPPAAAGPAPSSPAPALEPKSAFMAADN